MYEEYYQNNNNPSPYAKSEANVKSPSFLSRVYGYMFIGLLISTVVAFIAGACFNAWFNTGDVEKALTTYGGIIIVSFIGLLVISLIINFTSLKGNRSIAVPAIIYAALMGLVFSEFTLFVPFYIIGMAFVFTAGLFGVMYFIARFSKGNLSWVGTLGLGLLFGSMFMVIFFGLFYLLFPQAFDWLFVAVDAIMFIAVLLITMFDVWQIQKIADRGCENKNLALYCAFSLYVDFMYILMRIIYLLIRLYGDRR